MNTRTTRMLAGVTALAALLTMTATASPRPTEGDAARSLFERFKAIEGSWQTTSTAGWNEVSTFEVIAGVALKTITNFVGGVFGLPLDSQFQPHVWSPGGNRFAAPEPRAAAS